MKEVILTCPFTGVEFTALEYADKSLLITHPLTGEQVKINWNASVKRFNVPSNLFKHIGTLTQSETAKVLNVSRQRVSAIAKTGAIQPYEVNDSIVFLKSDVLEYAETRKPGAPCKTE